MRHAWKRNAGRSSGFDAKDEDALLDVVDREAQDLAETLDASWPDPAAGQEDRAALAGGIRLYDFFLAVYEKPERRDALRPAIFDFANGDYAAAKKKIEDADVPQEMLAQTLQVSGDVVGVLAFLAADKAWSGFNEYMRTRRRKTRASEEEPKPG